MPQLKNHLTPLQQRLLNPVINYSENPTHTTYDAIQREIIEYCYLQSPTKGDDVGGMTGSTSLNLYPKGTDATSQKQRATFEDAISTVNQLIEHTSRKNKPKFEWQGSHTFQLKPDSTIVYNKPIVREELNDNVAELITTCISDSIQSNHNYHVNQHPNSFAFVDSKKHTIIASQYLPNTISDLSGFLKLCIHDLHAFPEQLASKFNISSETLTALKNKYQHFPSRSKKDIHIVSELSQNPKDHDCSIELSDLDTLSSVFVASRQANNDPKYSHIDLNQSFTRHILEELSFSHLIADHDVNPGNFIIHLDEKSTQLVVSRIDFGMSNYHFTRGRIYGFSRRPFKNIIFDIPKESLIDFLTRKNIGFGFLKLTNVISKVWGHMSGFSDLFKKSNSTPEIKKLLADIICDNKDLHDFIQRPENQEDIIARFMRKIDKLPPKNLALIAKDLTIMKLQSIRTSYLQGGSRLQRLLSLFKLIAMVSLTPVLSICHFAVNLFLIPYNFFLSPTKPRIHNPVPSTTWSALSMSELRSSYEKSSKDPALAKQQIEKSLSQVLVNNSGDNKYHFEPQITAKYDTIDSSTFNQAPLPTSKPSSSPDPSPDITKKYQKK